MIPKWVFLDGPDETHYVLTRNSPSDGVVVILLQPRAVRIKEVHVAISVACGVHEAHLTATPNKQVVEFATIARLRYYCVDHLVVVNGQNLFPNEIRPLVDFAEQNRLQLWITSEGSSALLQDRFERTGAMRTEYPELVSILPDARRHPIPLVDDPEEPLPRIPSDHFLAARYEAEKYLTKAQFRLFDSAYRDGYASATDACSDPGGVERHAWTELVAKWAQYDDPELAVAATLGLQAGLFRQGHLMKILMQPVRHHVLSTRHRTMTPGEASRLAGLESLEEAVLLGRIASGVTIEDALTTRVADLAFPNQLVPQALPVDHPLLDVFTMALCQSEVSAAHPDDLLMTATRHTESKLRARARQLNIPFPARGNQNSGSPKRLMEAAAYNHFRFGVLALNDTSTETLGVSA